MGNRPNRPKGLHWMEECVERIAPPTVYITDVFGSGRRHHNDAVWETTEPESDNGHLYATTE